MTSEDSCAAAAAPLLQAIDEGKVAVRAKIAALLISPRIEPVETVVTAAAEAQELQDLVEQLEALGRLELEIGVWLSAMTAASGMARAVRALIEMQPQNALH